MEFQEVVIFFAGLRTIGFSREEAEEIWMSSENVRARNSPSNHPEFKTVHDFLFWGMPDFEDALNGVYFNNFETISTQFPELELNPHSAPRRIPLPVLHEVIQLYEAENPPQPRAVVVPEVEAEDSP